MLQARDRSVDQGRAGKRGQACRGLEGLERTRLVAPLLAEPAEPPLGQARKGNAAMACSSTSRAATGLPLATSTSLKAMRARSLRAFRRTAARR